MKTLHYSIITVLIFIILVTLIIEFPIYRGPNALIMPSKPYIEDTNTLHSIPEYAIGIVFNGAISSRDAPLYLKQGQNLTLVANITSIPTNLPVSLDIDSHVGFTKTNGVDSKLSVTKIKTPGQVMIYISATKDATPNTYQILVNANNTLMTMSSNFDVKVIPSDMPENTIDEQKARSLAESSVDELKTISYGCQFQSVSGIFGTDSNGASKLNAVQVGYTCNSRYIGAFVIIEDPQLTRVLNVTTFPSSHFGS